jgi:hypothetical protein
MYHTNHPDGTAHAGTAVIVKQTISHYELPKYEEDFLQTTSIRVKTLPYELTVTAVYSPPKYNLKRDHYELFFSTLGPRFMAGGDYNSKHTICGSRITTTKGRELYNLSQKKNYSFSTTGNPTYWPVYPNKQLDLLDFITHRISSTCTAMEPSYDLSSDHSPVIATISTSPIYVQLITMLHNSQTHQSNYRTKLHEGINLHISLKSCTEVEDVTNNFISLLQEAAQATPTIAYKKDVVNIPLDINP